MVSDRRLQAARSGTKALMVDVDGVLIRGRLTDGRHWTAGLEDDLGLPAADLHRAFFVPHWNDVVVGRATLIDRLTPVLATIAPHLTPQQLIDYWFRQDARLDEQLLADLVVLRREGIKVHLATNQDHMRAIHLMRSLGLSGYVDGIHYSAELGSRKPDPAFFQSVSARVRLKPAELLLVDDTIENVRAAEAAGWMSVHWTGELRLAELLPPGFDAG